MLTQFLLKLFATAIILLTAICGQHNASFAQQSQGSLHDLIRYRIEAGGVPLNITVGKEPIHAAIVLPVFYEGRIYQPAWTGSHGVLPHTDSLLKALGQADREGLQPADYHLAKIKSVLAELNQSGQKLVNANQQQLVDLDLLLTDAFLIFGAHLIAGRTNPEQIDPQWVANRREADLARLLEGALESKQIEQTLAGMLPAYDGYRRLRETLAIYRRIADAGGWPTIPAGSKLQQGDRGARIDNLTQRLAVEGFYTETGGTDQGFFDDDLKRALQQFQIQNGLEADGILGPQTLQALNIPADRRVRQIVVNMERWRWLPQNLGNRYILVNIAGFNLGVVEQEQQVLGMRVIAGKTYRKTPVFSDKMTYLVINPYWGVPDKIAKNDILPKQKKNPNYLADQKIRVFKGRDESGREIDPSTVDWATVAAGNFPYRFKQDPGPQNALGRVKFMFPNKFDVYLHDTPSKELFTRARRDFSSGCIRVEKPVDLAEYLLKNNPDWPPEKIRSTIVGSDFTAQTIKLPEPINIHILYWTAWVGNDNAVHFSPDVYDRDKALDIALQEPPPGT